MAGAAGRALILAGVGFDEQTAIEMAHFAAGQGAQALMVHQPVHPYRSDAGWVAYHQAIAEALSFIETGRFDPGISWMDSVFSLIGPGCGGGACGSTGLTGGSK